MPWFYDRRHYQAIVNILLAVGDLEAQTFHNPATQGVRVHLEDGTIITWTNSEERKWGFAVAGPDGSFRATHLTDKGYDAQPDDVAKLIATFDYDTVEVEDSLDQKRLDRTAPIATVEIPAGESE